MTESKTIKYGSIFDNHFNFERLRSFFEYTESDELILLKGHLLIEEIIDWRLTQKISNTGYKKLNLNFYRKVILFRSLYKVRRDDDLIRSILEINRIRNIYAHNLNPNIKEEFINYISALYGDDTPLTINRKNTYLNSMRRFFYLVLGQLYGQGVIEEYISHYGKL